MQRSVIKPIARTILLILLVCAWVRPIHAESQKPTLVIATVENLPPFVYIESGKLTGIAVDVVTELAKRAGFDVKIQTYPWARVLQQLQDGQVDGAFSVYEKEERKEFCLYTGVIHYDELRIATRSDRQFDFSGIKSLYGKTIGKGRDVYVGSEFDAAVRDGKISVSEVNDMDMSNIKKLYAGRVDAVIGSPAAMMYYAESLKMERDIVLLPVPLRAKIPAYFVLSKHSALANKEKWQRKIQAILMKMETDGTSRAINRRYGYVMP